MCLDAIEEPEREGLFDESNDLELGGTLAAVATSDAGSGEGALSLRSATSKGDTKKGRPTGAFTVLGQTFPSLAAVHAWLQAEATNPASTVPHEPVLTIDITPGSIIHQREATTWNYYNPNQQIVMNGNGAVVSGLKGEEPTAGFFLAYRPIVGSGTSQEAPANANFQMTGLTVRGYESGGVELSPQNAAGDDHRNDGGLPGGAFISGAVIEGNRFEDLGSKNTPYKKTSWSGSQRYGVGGILTRGVSDSRFSYNVFDGLENGEVRGSGNGPGLIHAVYLRDRSVGNEVVGNRFEDISGDPVRINNLSHDNVVQKNKSKNAGKFAMVNEFYNPTAAEGDSEGHRISGNQVGTLYDKDQKAKTFIEKISKAPRPKV